jgi:hypothetical protein
LGQPTVPTADVASAPWRWRFWLVRAVACLALALGCAGVVNAGWLGVLITVYGGLGTALKDMRPTATTVAGWAAFVASSPASFLGGFIAPLALGSVTRRHQAVVLSSVAGAALAAASAVVVGAIAGFLCWQPLLPSMAFAWTGLALGVPAGIGGGWIAGWVIKRAELSAACDGGRSSRAERSAAASSSQGISDGHCG